MSGGITFDLLLGIDYADLVQPYILLELNSGGPEQETDTYFDKDKPVLRGALGTRYVLKRAGNVRTYLGLEATLSRTTLKYDAMSDGQTYRGTLTGMGVAPIFGWRGGVSGLWSGAFLEMRLDITHWGDGAWEAFQTTMPMEGGTVVQAGLRAGMHVQF
jgi:hypothetical protein